MKDTWEDVKWFESTLTCKIAKIVLENPIMLSLLKFRLYTKLCFGYLECGKMFRYMGFIYINIIQQTHSVTDRPAAQVLKYFNTWEIDCKQTLATKSFLEWIYMGLSVLSVLLYWISTQWKPPCWGMSPEERAVLKKFSLMRDKTGHTGWLVQRWGPGHNWGMLENKFSPDGLWLFKSRAWSLFILILSGRVCFFGFWLVSLV